MQREILEKSQIFLVNANIMLFKRKIKVLIMAHTFNPSTWRQRQVSVVFIMLSRKKRAMHGELAIFKKGRQ